MNVRVAILITGANGTYGCRLLRPKIMRSAGGTRRLWAVLRNDANTILASARCRPASVLCPKLERVVVENNENVVDENNDYHAHRYAPNDSHQQSTISEVCSAVKVTVTTLLLALLALLTRRRRSWSRCSRRRCRCWCAGVD